MRDNLILIKPLLYAAIYFGWALRIWLIKWFILSLKKFGAVNFFKRALGILFFVFIVGSLMIMPLIRMVEPELNEFIKKPYAQGLIAIYFFIHGSIIFKGLFKYFYNLIFQKKSFDKRTTNNESIVFEASKPIFIDNIYRGLMVSGGAGSGKSASFVYPLLNQMIDKQFTGIVYDYKNPELTEFIKKASLYHSYPFKIVTVDFKNPQCSDRVNLLDGLSRVAEVKELSSSLWKNLNKDSIKNGGSFWNSSAENVLTASFFTLIKKFPKYATIPHALAILLSFSLDELIYFLSLDNQARGLVSQLINSHQLGASNQTAGVVGTLTNYLGVLNTPENFYVLSGTQNPAPNSIDNPCLLLLGNDSTLSDSITPILAMIFTTSVMKMNKSNQYKSMIVVDELPTIFLPNLKQIPAVARSNKIATCVTVQDKTQLEDSYGTKETEVILSNLGSQFFGRSTLESTNKYISNLFGKHDVSYKSTNVSNSGGLKRMSSSRGVSYSVQERNRLKPQDIANFKPGEFAGIIAEGSPNEFVSNSIKIFDKSQINTIELKSLKKVEYKVLEDNFNRIYSDVELIKEQLKNQ